MKVVAVEFGYKGRNNRLVGALEAEGLDGYVATMPANLRYFTGTTVRTGLLLVTRGAAPRLMIREQNGSAVGSMVEGCEVGLLPGGGGWEAAVVEALRPLLPGRIACDDLPLSLATALRAAVPSALLSLRPDIAASLRRRKDAVEESLLRRAAAIADEAASAAFAVIKPGVSELAVVAEIEAALRRAGADGTRFPTRFGSGPRSADCDVEPSRKVIEAGEIGLFDIGPTYEGYLGDISRGFMVGEPSEEQARIADLAVEVLERVAANVRPGVPVAKLWALALETYDRAGLAWAFRHHLGHGLGLAMDPPLIRQGSLDRLEEGDFIALEPGLYLPGVGGVRFENNFRVGPGGPELLTHFPLSYRVGIAI